TAEQQPREVQVNYETVDTIPALEKAVRRARGVEHIAVDVETVSESGAPLERDPLRSVVIGLTIAIAPGEAFYFPLAHRERAPDQGALALGDAQLELTDEAPAAPKKTRAKKGWLRHVRRVSPRRPFSAERRA